jgi:hypothetical protein
VNLNETDAGLENQTIRGTPTAEPARVVTGHDQLTHPRTWVALAGVLAGLTAFAVGEAVYDLIPVEKVEVNTMGHILMAPTPKTTALAEIRNAALTFGILGLCLGGFLGIASGLLRRSAVAMAVAGLVGSIVGLATGACICFAVLPFFFDKQAFYPEYDLILSMIMHGSIWGLTAAAAGLAFGVGQGEPRLLGRALAASFIGAALGAVVFDLIGAAVFPMALTGQPISTTWPTRLMARLLVTVAAAAGVMLVMPRPLSRKGRPPEVV